MHSQNPGDGWIGLQVASLKIEFPNEVTSPKAEVAPPTALVRPPMMSETGREKEKTISAISHRKLKQPGYTKNRRVPKGLRDPSKVSDRPLSPFQERGRLTLPRFQFLSFRWCLSDSGFSIREDASCIESREGEDDGVERVGEHCMCCDGGRIMVDQEGDMLKEESFKVVRMLCGWGRDDAIWPFLIASASASVLLS